MVAFFSIGAIIGLSIYVPLYLQLVLGASPSVSGLALIAFTAGTVIGAFFAAGRSLGRSRHYMRLPMAGLAIGMASLAVMAALPAGLSLAGLSCLLFLCGAGIGPMYPVTTVLIQNAVLPHRSASSRERSIFSACSEARSWSPPSAPSCSAVPAVA